MKNPQLVRHFKFLFGSVCPASILSGTTYSHQAGMLREGHIEISPALGLQKDVTIIEVTGMSMAEVLLWFSHPDDFFRLAKAAEVVEIAEVNRDVQERGRFYAAGEFWSAGKNTLYLYLDNEEQAFVPGRASHIDTLSPGDENRLLGNGHKVFVAVIGDCPRLEQVA